MRFIIGIILISSLWGCETTKGMVRGIKTVGEGLKKDIKNTIQIIKKADQKFRENYW